MNWMRLFLDEFGQLAQPAKQLAVSRLIKPARVAIIEKARQLDPGIACLMDTAGKRNPLLIHAHDDSALWRPLQASAGKARRA